MAFHTPVLRKDKGEIWQRVLIIGGLYFTPNLRGMKSDLSIVL